MRRRFVQVAWMLALVACVGCAGESHASQDAEKKQSAGASAGEDRDAAGSAASAVAGTGAGTAAVRGGASAAGGGASSESMVSIPCTEAEWTQNCGANCRFDPATLDCTAACMNLSKVCKSGCPACMGMNLDQATCMLGCSGYRSVTCFNRLLGCFTSNATCESETACANAMH